MTTVKPNRKDQLRPVELLAIAGVMALFVGIIVFMSTRDFTVAGIFTGIVFIIALVALAMMVLALKPDGDEKLDISEQDRDHDLGSGRGH